MRVKQSLYSMKNGRFSDSPGLFQFLVARNDCMYACLVGIGIIRICSACFTKRGAFF